MTVAEAVRNLRMRNEAINGYRRNVSAVCQRTAGEEEPLYNRQMARNGWRRENRVISGVEESNQPGVAAGAVESGCRQKISAGWRRNGL